MTSTRALRSQTSAHRHSTSRIRSWGLRSLILVDSVTSDEPAGTLALYRKEDILRDTPGQRLDPHSPALSECLMTAEMLGAMPEHVLLVGIAGECYEPRKSGEHGRAAIRGTSDRCDSSRTAADWALLFARKCRQTPLTSGGAIRKSLFRSKASV